MNNKKPIVAIDFDGTLCKSQERLLFLFNAFKGTDYKLEQIKGWDMEKLLGISNTELLRWFENVWDNHEHLPPTEPAIARVIDRIRDNGNRRISIISKRTKAGAIPMIRWLNWNGIHYDDLIMAFDSRSKSEFPFDVLIDDAVAYIEDLQPPKVGILISQPWNQSFDHQLRVSSLSEAASLIEKLYPSVS